MSTLHDLTGLASQCPRQIDEELLNEALAPVGLPPGTMAQLMAAAFAVELPEGPLRHPCPTRPVRALWLLRRGELALGGRDRHGCFTETRRVHRGEWMDVFGALGTQPAWFHDLTALRDSEALALPLNAVVNAMCTDPAATLAFGQVLAGQAVLLRDGLRTLRNCGFGARLAGRVLDETACSANGQPQSVWTMHIRKQHLAQQLGVSSETLSRGLRALVDAGVIAVRAYAVHVLDREALAEVERTGNLPGLPGGWSGRQRGAEGGKALGARTKAASGRVQSSLNLGQRLSA